MQDLLAPVEMLDERGAPFDPVAVIIISDVTEASRLGGVDMAADDTVHPQPRRFVRDRLLEARYEGDRVLHLAFGVLRQRPVRQTEPLAHGGDDDVEPQRSEEHTSELQSLMRISYAVFCLTKKK